MRDNVGSLEIQLFSFFNRLFQILVYLFRKTLLHHSIVENIFSEDFSYIDLFCAHI